MPLVSEIQAVLKLKDEATQAFTHVWQQMQKDAETGSQSLGVAMSNLAGNFGQLASAIETGPLAAFQTTVQVVESSVEVLAAAVKDNFTGIVGITAGLGAAFLGIGAEIVHLGEQGSDISDLEDAFNRMSGGSEKAATNINALSAAMDGTVKKTDLQRAMLPALSAGLKLTSDDYTLIGHAAMDMGIKSGNATEALDNISRALASGRPQLLAHYGVLGSNRQATMDFTEATGIAAGQLMGAQRVQAMASSTLKELKTFVDANGISQESFGSRVKEVKAIWGDYMDDLGVAVARSPVVAAAFDVLSDALKTAFGNDSKTRIATLMTYVENFAILAVSAAQEVVAAVKFMGDAYYGMRVVFDWLVSAAAKMDVDIVDAWNDAVGYVGTGVGKLVEYASRAQGASADTAKALGDGVAASVKNSQKFSDDTIKGLNAIADGYSKDTESALGSLKNFDAGMDKTSGVLGTMQDRMKKAADGIHNIGEVTHEAFDPLAQEATANAHAMAILTAEIAAATKAHMPLNEIVKLFGATADTVSEKAVLYGQHVNDSIKTVAQAFESGMPQAALANADAIQKLTAQIDAMRSAGVPMVNIVDQFGGAAQKAAEGAVEFKTKLASGVQVSQALTTSLQDVIQATSELALSQGKVVTSLSSNVTQELGGVQEAADRFLGQYKQAFGETLDDTRTENDNAWQQIYNKVVFATSAQSDEAKKVAALWKQSDDLIVQQDQEKWDALLAEPGKYEQLLSDMLGNLPNLVSQALTGGGGFGGALKAGFSQLSGGLFKNLFDSSAVTNFFGANLINPLTKMFGSTFAVGIGTALPGIGQAIGAVIGPALSGLWNHFFGDAGRQAVAQFAQSFASPGMNNGFDNLQQKLAALGASGQALWVQLTQGTGRNNPQQAQQNIQAVQDALNKLQNDVSKYNLTVSDMVAGTTQANMAFDDEAKSIAGTVKELTDAGYSQDALAKNMAGDLNQLIADSIKTGKKIPASLQPILDKLAEMGLLTQDNAAKLLGLPSAIELSGGSFDDVMAAAQRYGLTLDDLGPKVNQLNIDKVAQQLSSDWKLLTSDGEDVNQVMLHMQKQVQDVVTEALKFGDTIPDSMKPMIDAMINAGLLTDQFGNKLTDDSKINFSKDLTTQVSDLVGAINKLVDALTGKGPNSAATALKNIGDTTVHPKIVVDTDWTSYTNGPLTGGGHAPGGGGGPSGAAIGGYVMPWGIQHFAGGGPVFPTDTVPAMLTPGEMVLTAAQQGHLAEAMMSGGGGDVYVYLGNELLDKRAYQVTKKKAQRGAFRTRAGSGRSY